MSRLTAANWLIGLFPIFRNGKSVYISSHLIPKAGALAIVTNVGMGVAVDAEASDRRTMLRRTAKALGSDIPKLVSSLRSCPQATVAKRAPGRERYKP